MKIGFSIIILLLFNLALLGVTANISEPSDENGLKIVIAKGNSYFTINYGLYPMVEHLTANGHEVSQLTRDPSANDLVNVDVFMSFGHTLPDFSSNVIELIVNFVANGGGLIMNAHSRGLNFDVEMLASDLNGVMGNFYGNNSVSIVDHPVTKGLDKVIISEGAGYQKMNISQNGQVVVKTTAEANYPNIPIVAINEFESGKIMALNTVLLTGGVFNDHSIILDNFLSWQISDSLETDKEIVETETMIYAIDKSINLISIYIGLITLLGLLTSLGYTLRVSQNPRFPISMELIKIINPFVKNSPILNLMLHSKANDIDSEVVNEFREIIPSEFFQFKFLLHPIRLAIIKLLYDKGTLSLFELKTFIEIQSSVINYQLLILENMKYIERENKFFNESPSKIIHLTVLGSKNYRLLSNLLTEFISK